MNIDLGLNEYSVDTQELARITARNILSQIGLRVITDNVRIENLDLFQSKIPEIIRDTKFTINDYTLDEPILQTNVEDDDDTVLSDNEVLSPTELTVRLFFSRPEYQELEQAYQIQEMTSEGRFIYSNGKTSEYDSTLINYIYKNLLEYYSSHYPLEDIQLDIQNNYGDVSLYVLSRILASIEKGVFDEFPVITLKGD